jgi:4-hydroxymandelate oxidase
MAEQNTLPETRPSRRRAIGVMGATTAAAAAAAGAALSASGAGAQSPAIAPGRTPTPAPALAPQADLVNVLEYEAQARLVLGAAKLAPIAGSDRTVTDRITLRPNMVVPTRDLDLTCPLFGDNHFTPIIVGPIADQQRFHAEGEVATARGASAAQAGIVVSSESSAPLARIGQALTTPLWVQVYAGNPQAADILAQAHAANSKAIIVTINAGASAPDSAAPGAVIDWAAVDAIVKGTALPVIVKGVTTPEEAKAAVAHGAKGVVVSNYRGGDAATLPGTLLLIAPVVRAVGSRIPVLVDGSFRRGTDIIKALAFGARAVMVGRPVMWGLSAYGADGVKGVVEMLQTELARYMAMCGRPTLASVDSSLVRVHAPLSAESRTNG